METYLQLKEKFPYLSNSILLDLAEFILEREKKATIESYASIQNILSIN